MTVDERSRHALFTRLEEVLGQEHAAVLIEHLPPVGWADVATKHDLIQLERRMDAKFEGIDGKCGILDSKFEALDFKFEALDFKFEAFEHKLLAEFRAEINSLTRTLIFSMITAFVGVAGLAVAAARLIQ